MSVLSRGIQSGLRADRFRIFSLRRVVCYQWNCTSLINNKSPTLYLRRLQHSSPNKEVVTSKEETSQVSTSVAETVKETTKTVSYLSVIIVGFGVTGIILYAVFSELMSSKSPNSVYTDAADKCSKDTRIIDALGAPIKAFGEETRRRRRQHVSHIIYLKDGVEHLRMRFYLQGSRERGIVQLEVKEDSHGKYQYRYLFLQLESTGRVIILEDNRALESSTAITPNDNFDFSQPLAYGSS